MNIMRHTAALLLAMALLAPAAYADEPEAPSKEPVQTEEAAPSPEEEGWNLLLVNPGNSLPEDFTVELAKLSNGMRVDKRICGELDAMLSACGLKVDKRIRTDLNEMFCACQEAGLRPLICSAYRTQAVQTRLYNNKISRLQAAGYGRESAREEAGRWVAVPGTSEHQTGLALDIVSAGYQLLNKKQETTAEQKWLMEHCWEYGFILRYPSEKCEITGIGYEPWHYRYVGKEAALAMRDSGLCLEEYLEELEKAAQKTPAYEENRSADGGPVLFVHGRETAVSPGRPSGRRPCRWQW